MGPMSGEPFKPERKRRRDQDPVMVVPNSRATPPVPTPTSVELLAELIETVKTSEAAAQARHAEVMQ